MLPIPTKACEGIELLKSLADKKNGDTCVFFSKTSAYEVSTSRGAIEHDVYNSNVVYETGILPKYKNIDTKHKY